MDIFASPVRNRKILRNFYFFLPKFHFILPKFYFAPTWGMFFSYVGICKSLRGDFENPPLGSFRSNACGRFSFHQYGPNPPSYLFISVARPTRVTRCKDAAQDDSCRDARGVSISLLVSLLSETCGAKEMSTTPLTSVFLPLPSNERDRYLSVSLSLSYGTVFPFVTSILYTSEGTQHLTLVRALLERSQKGEDSIELAHL